MATYNPPQPMWKRNLAGILDFFLAFFACVYGVSKIFATPSDGPDTFGKPFASYNFGDGQCCWRLHWSSPISLFSVRPEARSFKGCSA